MQNISPANESMHEPRHTPVLQTRALNLSMGARELFRDLNLTIKAGQCLGVLGQNGTGKTSLLHTLINLRPSDGGEIMILGRELNAWSRRELATRLGILFQSGNDDMPATVMETALLGRHPHLARWRWEDAEDVAEAHAALSAMQLDALVERDITTLSGGERQRVAIATLLAQRPQLYLLDEPGNHLDIAFQIRCLEVIRQRVVTDGLGLCMATHDINLAARFCDQILLLTGDGEFLLGATHDILTPENLSRAYGCNIRQVTYEGGSVFFPG